MNLFLADFNYFEPLCVSVPESHESHKDFPHGLTASQSTRVSLSSERPPRLPPRPPSYSTRYVALRTRWFFFRFNTSNIGYRSWSCLCVFNLLPLSGLGGRPPSEASISRVYMMSKLAVLKLASLLNDAFLFYYQTNMRLFDKRGFFNIVPNK